MKGKKMSILSEPVSFTVYRSQDDFFLGNGITVYTKRRAEMVKESLSRKGYPLPCRRGVWCKP